MSPGAHVPMPSPHVRQQVPQRTRVDEEPLQARRRPGTGGARLTVSLTCSGRGRRTGFDGSVPARIDLPRRHACRETSRHTATGPAMRVGFAGRPRIRDAIVGKRQEPVAVTTDVSCTDIIERAHRGAIALAALEIRGRLRPSCTTSSTMTEEFFDIYLPHRFVHSRLCAGNRYGVASQDPRTERRSTPHI